MEETEQTAAIPYGAMKQAACLFAAVIMTAFPSAHIQAQAAENRNLLSTLEMMLVTDENTDEETDQSWQKPDAASATSIFDLTGMTDPVKTAPDGYVAADDEDVFVPEHTVMRQAGAYEQQSEEKAGHMPMQSLAGTPGYDENGILVPVPKVFTGGQAFTFEINYENNNPIPDNMEPIPTVSIHKGTSEGHITKRGGVFQGPSGKETYYNLPMQGVVKIMRRQGYSEDEWPYWVRDDGAKMLGDYIMVAAHLGIRPRGTILETSLGPGIVCDTGDFALSNATQIDIALDW